MFRVAGWGRALGAWLALASAAALAQQPAAPPARVYGIEIERGRQSDRLLVFSDRAVAARVEPQGDDALVLHLEGATLDPSAPTHLVQGAGSALRELRVEASDGPSPALHLRIRRTPGLAAPRLSQRDTIVALEFPRPPPEADRTVTFRLVNRPLRDLVEEVHKQTQQRFIYDERLEGSATVIVTEPVTAGEALEILHATLIGKGFAAVPTPGGVLAVVPLDEARTRAPREERALRETRAGLVTALARFDRVDAETVASVLQPAAGVALTVVPYAPTNGVILVGSESHVHRWLALARTLDETASAELHVIQPRHRSAAELFPLLEAVTLDPLTGRPRAELWLDARANLLIARAMPPALAALRERLAALDVAPEETGEIAVLRPRFADPEKLAEILRSGALGSGRGGPETEAALALAGSRLDIAVHPSTRSLVVSADPATLRRVREVIEQLDREPPGIEVELHVLALVTDGGVDLGVSFFLPTADPSKPGNIGAIAVNNPLEPKPAFGFGRYARTPVVIPVFDENGLPLPPIILPRDIVELHASAGSVLARTVMRPHLMTASGEEHELAAGLNVPVPTAAAPSASGGAGDPLVTRVDVERQDVGLRMRVKPVAGEGGTVTLTIDVELTDVRDSLEVVAVRAGPVLGKRTLHATAVVRSGEAAVLGMLLDGDTSTTESGPPFLKDVPALGNLLRESRDESARSHLLIAVQARQLRSADERIADTIRLRTAHERALARYGELRERGASWALLVATRTQRADAEALAAEVSELGGRAARVVAWSWADAERFDVVLSGYASVAEASAGLAALEAAGLRAQLVAVDARSD
jgi:general secretion pathway protein D